MHIQAESGPKRPRISRRYFLAQGKRLLTLSSLGALFGALGLPRSTAGQDWSQLASQRPRGGFGTVKDIAGEASAAGRVLRKNSRVESGERIQVEVGGRLILSLSDNTIMRINGNTVLELDIGSNRTGLFRLIVGSLLTVMPTKNLYLVQLPTAVVGIKGTVFFQQIFHPGETTALGMENKQLTIPQGIREYFCLCNGAVDFMNTGNLKAFYSDAAEHHNSYYIDPRQEGKLIKAPMVNHDDKQIRGLINLQEGPKHSSEFLDEYEGEYY
ncbi:MAG: FecR family protein [Deltaproteobacteria bacterium]|nr:FecR family protein [Deltaproteobacteria bacterium]